MSEFKVEQLQVVRARPRVFGSRIGRLTELIDGRIPVVDYDGNQLGPQVARLAGTLGPKLGQMLRDGTAVLLVFEQDDPSRPVIVDSVLDSVPDPDVNAAQPAARFAAAHTTPSLPALPAIQPSKAAPGVRVATIVGVEKGVVLVRMGSGDSAPVEAMTTVTLRNLKDPVLVLNLEDHRTVIVGQLHDRIPIDPAGAEATDVVLKGDRVVIEAAVELVLKAGNCSLHLDARGKVVTAADQIVSRARDVNKVQGGCVQLN